MPRRIAHGHRDHVAHRAAVVALCVILRSLSAGGGAGQLAGGLGRETVRRKVAVFSLATVAHGFLRAGRRAAVVVGVHFIRIAADLADPYRFVVVVVDVCLALNLEILRLGTITAKVCIRQRRAAQQRDGQQRRQPEFLFHILPPSAIPFRQTKPPRRGPLRPLCGGSILPETPKKDRLILPA